MEIFEVDMLGVLECEELFVFVVVDFVLVDMVVLVGGCCVVLVME